MEPRKHATTMAALDLMSSFPNAHQALPRDAHALVLLLHKDGSQQSPRPQPQEGRSTHHVRVAQTTFLLSIAATNLDVPACSHVREKPLGIGLHSTGSPGAGLSGRGRLWRTMLTWQRESGRTLVVTT